MVDVRDYYAVLGVPRAATAADIKKAFRKAAREHHPDKKPGDKVSEQRFKDLNEANEVLSDPDKRAKYDRFGRDWEAYSRAGASAGARGAGGQGADPFGPGGPFQGYTTYGGTGGGNVRYEFRTSGEGGQFSDFFRMMFGEEAPGPAAGHGGSRGAGPASGARGAGPASGARGGAASLEDILAGMGVSGATSQGSGRTGRGGSAGAASAVFAPVEATAEISLEEAFHGTTRIVEIGGKRLEVKIPQGVDTGSRVRLTGKGPDGRDLIVVIRAQPHGVFKRRGTDLEREVPVSLREALLGGGVAVRTLKGKVLLTLPPGTQNGKTFRLSRQGMPRLKGGDPGDLYVRVRVVLPTHLSDAETEAAQGFLDLVDQPDPRA